MENFETPILFLIFNRPDTTRIVFEEIRKQTPKYLYVAADGFRENKAGEKELCEKTRRILDLIDWDCELRTLFQDKNLGCGKAVSSAITWFFSQVEQGIILEDDCVPHPDFFTYCELLLERYKDRDQIKLIGGTNFQDGIVRGNTSYYYSAYAHIWGWASWRRAWVDYSFSLETYSMQTFKRKLRDYFSSWGERQFWIDKFFLMRQKKIDTWDYQLSFSIWMTSGLAIIPNKNLISNIGFGSEATHTTKEDDKAAAKKTESLSSLVYPQKIDRNIEADSYYYRHYIKKSPLQHFYRYVKRIYMKIFTS